MRAIALSFVAWSGVAWAQSTPDVMEFLRSLATTLSTAHTSGDQGAPEPGLFLDNFDSSMPGFATFRNEIEELVTTAMVGTQIEVISDDGDENKRMLQLDWILEIDGQQTRRKIINCTIERVKGKWKVTALDPIEFFKY